MKNPKTKKIVIMINNLSIGGAQRLVVDSVNEMINRGHEVFLVTTEKETSNSLSTVCKIKEKNWKKIYFKNSRDLSSWFKLFKFLFKNKPDILMTHLWFANNVGRVVGFLVGVRKILAFEHSVYDLVKVKKQFMADRILQYFSTTVIAVSKSVKDSLIRNGIKESRIVVIYNGIKIESFIKSKSHKPKELTELGTEEFKFVFVGRLISAKAIDILIKAFSEFSSGSLIIVGDGPLRPDLEKLSQKLNLGKRVIFLGYRQDAIRIISLCDCLVLPSRREGFGLVLLEAMSVGVPVISSNFPASGEIINNGENGLIFEVENKKKLVKSMKMISEDNVLRDNLIKKGLKTVEHYSIGYHLDRVLSL